jgi:hypothetical protein
MKSIILGLDPDDGCLDASNIKISPRQSAVWWNDVSSPIGIIC